MGEIDVPAHVRGRRYLCEHPLDPDAMITCGLEMERVKGVRLPTSPPQYPHRCANGHTKNLSNSYPHYVVIIEAIPTRTETAKRPWWRKS